jgi:5'-3' exonuclease
MADPLYIDANNLIHRAIHACAKADMQAGGVYTGGTYVSITMLADFCRMHPYARPVFAFFDDGIPAHRLKLIPSYKQERGEKRAAIPAAEREKAFAQLDLTREAFGMLGIPCISKPKHEADDLVAAAVKGAVARKQNPIVMSSDRDLLQTVNMGAQVWNFKTTVDTESFEEAVGVPPDRYLLYKTLVGDPSDSTDMGCNGCGEKTALEWSTMFELAGKTPAEQLKTLRDMVFNARDNTKAETGLLDCYKRLQGEMKAIDLSGVHVDQKWLDKAMAVRPKASFRDFLKFAHKHSLQRFMQDPDRYIKPIMKAAGQ